MESPADMDALEKIERLQDLLRQAFAIATEIGYQPNIRTQIEHERTQFEYEPSKDRNALSLLSAHVAPSPVVPISSESEGGRIPPPIEADE
jgi:hypothetical protein